MGFKETLIQALDFERLAKNTIHSFGRPDGAKRIDKESARRLLEQVGYAPRSERDLELYVPVSAEAGEGIVVLDNELPLYKATAEDIAMRKSPTVKEMISFRNVKKILVDTDVVESKQQETVRTLFKRYMDRQDLSFSEEDIQQLADDGGAALKRELTDGVIDILNLFASLLAYQEAPPPFRLSQHHILGPAIRKPGGRIHMSSAVIYAKLHNRLVMIESPLDSSDPEAVDRMEAAARGDEEADRKGEAVFQALAQRVLVHLPQRVFMLPIP
jgi:hypothetical protein